MTTKQQLVEALKPFAIAGLDFTGGFNVPLMYQETDGEYYELSIEDENGECQSLTVQHLVAAARMLGMKPAADENQFESEGQSS